MSKPVAPLYRAASWSTAPDDKGTKRQPHLFYRAEDIDPLFDRMKARYEFLLRRAAAVEAFYLGEIGKDVPPVLDPHHDEKFLNHHRVKF